MTAGWDSATGRGRGHGVLSQHPDEPPPKRGLFIQPGTVFKLLSGLVTVAAFVHWYTWTQIDKHKNQGHPTQVNELRLLQKTSQARVLGDIAGINAGLVALGKELREAMAKLAPAHQLKALGKDMKIARQKQKEDLTKQVSDLDIKLERLNVQLMEVLRERRGYDDME